MESQQFIAYCRAQIAESFRNSAAGKPDPTQKHRTEGLIHAARMLGVLDKTSIDAMIEEEHVAAFGESVQSRKLRKKEMEDLLASAPEKFYEIPAYERKRTL